VTKIDEPVAIKIEKPDKPKIYKKEDNPYLSNFGKNAFSYVDENENDKMLSVNDPLLEARIKQKMKDLEDEPIEYEDIYEKPIKKEITPRKNPMKDYNNLQLPELKEMARRMNINIRTQYINKQGKYATKIINKNEIIELIKSQDNISL
jgi:hypothetical protein